MSLVVKYDPTATNFERPVGIQQAIVSSVVDMGDRPDPFHEGKMKHQVAITWQLGATYKKDDKVFPLQQTEIYNFSLNEKAKLRAIIEGIIGKSLSNGKNEISFDLEMLVGVNCILTMALKDPESQYTKIVATAPLMANLAPLKLVDLPIPSWIVEMRDGKKATVVDPSSKKGMSEDELNAILART